MQNNKRINTIDSFRFIAIISVILFHYYSRWVPIRNKGVSLYPYGDKYSFFNYGFLGVNFFFIISGFVIAYTLHTTSNFQDFWKKRLIRLIPPIFICSLVTLLIFTFIDTDNIFPRAHSVTNFFGSLTLLSPLLVEKMSGSTIHFDYLNGSYWSLWPEIQFYFIASLLYYLNPAKFIPNFSITAIGMYALNWFIGNVYGSNVFHVPTNEIIETLHTIVDTFNIMSFALWFYIGTIFFKLYSKEYNTLTILSLSLAILLQFYTCIIWPARLIFILMIMVFYLFTFYPIFLNWLNYKIITEVGVASYTLYLIHENIGVLLINKYAAHLGKFDFLFPLLLIILFIFLAMASYRFIEKPITKFLTRKFISRPL